jgi:hypothetical protein
MCTKNLNSFKILKYLDLDKQWPKVLDSEQDPH